MWPFTKKRDDKKSCGPIRILVRVIGCLEPGTIRVIVGPGFGMLDGGSEQTWPIDQVPADLRLPNAEFYLVRDNINAKDRLVRLEPEL